MCSLQASNKAGRSHRPACLESRTIEQSPAPPKSFIFKWMQTVPASEDDLGGGGEMQGGGLKQASPTIQLHDLNSNQTSFKACFISASGEIVPPEPSPWQPVSHFRSVMAYYHPSSPPDKSSLPLVTRNVPGLCCLFSVSGSQRQIERKLSSPLEQQASHPGWR